MIENLNPEFGMVGVIGADFDELSQLCEHNPDVEISCINSIGNYSLSGKIVKLIKLLILSLRLRKKSF